MPKILTIGSEEFEFPIENENGHWGEEVTDWATAVSTALGTVQQRNDIPITTAPVINNITIPTAVPGFSFDTTEVISVQAEYIVRRNTDTSSLVESGVIRGNFDGQDWYITIKTERDAGITLDITSSGQITYTTTNQTGANYDGFISFKARVFNQTEE